MKQKMISYLVRIGLEKSKSCKPFLINVVSVQGTLSFMKLDHITSHVLHINSPGATSGFIVLLIISLKVSTYINVSISRFCNG